MNLRILIFLLSATVAFGQPSYWFQGFQRQGNAQLAQQYFFLPGTNMVFTYSADNHVVLNSAGGTNSSSSGIASNKGVVALSSGTKVIPTTLAYSTNVIQLTYVSTDGTHFAGVSVKNIVPGVSFTIQSSLSQDNNNVCWSILNP